ncbi:RNA-directed DNA polymerase [Vibrio navarrensis]|uniref:RNA-directed DNA polymerase n=1 Tax=Vibrio navarrensis TaxID=29495 RepID=A0AAI9CXZ4_9VIBR|nr:RNA-directed DNA polymerase [Vibrio navarrensis]
MASEIKINKHDYLRVILTDVHPYELPFIITNEGFYLNLKDDDSVTILNALFSSYKELKPYDFKITKNGKSLRKLSLIHPYAQKKFTSFYREHHDIIKSKCSLSKFSLRYPVDIALYYVANREEDIESGLKDEGVDTVCEAEDLIPAYASSFFTYKKYNFLYKFYDSYTFHRLERRFSKLHKFDISKCFENLSIDMLPVALRGEDLFISDQYSSNTFESKFSKLLSYSNHSRTHGIVIGPEFSRIYAEILLQKIDSQIESRIKELGIKYGVDYVIKRYVDDYFLFYNDDRLLGTIVSESVNVLSNYKLFINESKNEDFTRPFITGVTSAKMSISSFFDELFSHVNVDSKSLLLETTSSFYNFNKVSNNLITKLKCIIKSHNVEYESISGYFLTILRKKIAEIAYIYRNSAVDSKNSDSISRFLLLVSELMFFIYSMDSRVRSTYLVSEIVIQISDICKSLNYESELMITDKIIQEAKFSIKNAIKGVDNVESLNLALSLQELNTENALSVNDLKSLLNIENDNSINYFQLVVGLYFIKNNRCFYKLKRELCEKAIDKVINTIDPLKDSECVHIIFDTLTCPYLTEKYKFGIVEKLYDRNVIPEKIEKHDFYYTISKRKWFVDWSELSIKRLLKKKRLRSPY